MYMSVSERNVYYNYFFIRGTIFSIMVNIVCMVLFTRILLYLNVYDCQIATLIVLADIVSGTLLLCFFAIKQTNEAIQISIHCFVEEIIYGVHYFNLGISKYVHAIFIFSFCSHFILTFVVLIACCFFVGWQMVYSLLIYLLVVLYLFSLDDIFKKYTHKERLYLRDSLL